MLCTKKAIKFWRGGNKIVCNFFQVDNLPGVKESTSGEVDKSQTTTQYKAVPVVKKTPYVTAESRILSSALPKKLGSYSASSFKELAETMINLD